ncbi:MAG: hypothetical protein WCI05_10575 [Myxococcales bacterium]
MHALPLLLLMLLAAGCSHSAAARADAGRDGGALDGARADARFSSYDASPEDDGIPPTTSEELATRARHLLEAIAQDTPDFGLDMLFPRDAYASAREVRDPGKVWEKKLSAVYKKQIHRLHKKKGIERAQFVGLEIGRSIVSQLPRHGGWKRSVWVVRHSKLAYNIDGKTYRINIAEMTSWRGSWYITRLH